MNVNALSRKVTIGHYVATITEELEPLDSDYSRFMRLARTVGDGCWAEEGAVLCVIDGSQQQLFDLPEARTA
jgi:hypothetical protein